ncbi:hypothetical protein [Acidimangrovimonas sediminis]|uniref:hypothetical protein n=1 Tax=Acidimangrovimonas sediminis TaxID=2056283 RepID=UPI000C8014B4|nr:hypothetical protein [Acidimangrovimonas sediminis]
MGIVPKQTLIPALAVPVAQILETRRAFPQGELSYEFDVQTADTWQGLAQFSLALAAAGLTPRLLRCGGDGRISVRAEDPGRARLDLLDAWFQGQALVTLQSWTTVIG